jgi:hypothetical protein
MFSIESYTISIDLFTRFLGFTYFCAIGAFLFQIKGLIGINGILPLSLYLTSFRHLSWKKRYTSIPTIFWLNSTDTALFITLWIGVILSIGLMLGFYPAFILFLLYFLYLSIVSAGQDFLSFGWEGFLLEITIHGFLLNLTSTPNLVAWISANFLLFRFHLQAGAVKLQSHDPSWRNLTAIQYHYQTQPLPNTQAWYIYHFPLWFHQLSVILMFMIELVVPFAIFGTEEMRLIAYLAFVSLQFMIWFTGNFSFLNYLTTAFCTILLSNTYLSQWISPPINKPETAGLFLMISFLATILLSLQIIQLWNHFFPHPVLKKILYWIYPFHLANRYGIFAVMTTVRNEIIIEGSADGNQWKEYTFKYKPSEITRRPRRISPYQPRLDWQAWFLPFDEFESNEWFQSFLYHLLKGTPEVLHLIRDNPFPHHPPLYIRAMVYQYAFSTPEEKMKKGWWWRREWVAPYSPILQLKNPIQN